MRFFKRALNALLCAALIFSIGISATACDVDEDANSDDTTNNPDNSGGNNDNIFTPPDDGSEGIDWSKYWDGVLDTESSTDNFKFTGSKEIGSVSGEFLPDVDDGTPNQNFIVKFSDGVPSQIVEKDSMAVKPVTPKKDGSMFIGWYVDDTYSAKYDFNSLVTKNLNLYAKWESVGNIIQSVKGFNESLAVTWTDSNPDGASVEYKSVSDTVWLSVDKPLIRKVDNNARVDVIGLPAGDYNVKITPSSGSAYTLPAPVTVDAYDRSGYAHFKYDEGVGAYKDNGSLKDGALVIYVNDANKNDISDSVYKNTANGLIKEDISQYFWTDLNNKVQKGIGYLLNNRQYRNNTEREKYGIQALSYKYGAVAIRFSGKIVAEDPATESNTAKLVLGLTAYNSTDFGGTVGDNGRMARITNAKNITVEGIGEDAEFWGWGIHFVSNDNLHKYAGSGKGFEARNLIFTSYPEDALGMEGTQGTKVDPSTGSITGGASDASADLISPVERCWIHNNVFNQGGCENAAESDKKEGDGSCDFKRGQYYTLSYNYFTDCHKTNLLGSSDTSLTYNVSIHHNWYNKVQSRQPLTRRANVHYYNNYISDATDYVSSFRANCLVFSEANYFDGCKNVTQKKNGEGVAWNNIYYACYSENNYTELSERTETVANECKFIGRNIDYTKFYIESDKFYYDSINQVSDCLLDTATGARTRVIQHAGVHNFGANETSINEHTPTQAVSNGVVTLPTTKPGATVNGILFNGITGISSGTIKGKGQIITFMVTAPVQLTVTTSTVGDSAPELIQSNGKVWASKFTGTLTIVLPAGTYVIASGQKDKEATISKLEFADTEASSKARIEAAKTALASIPSTITMSCEKVIEEAKKAYGALLGNEKTEIPNELFQRYAKAVEAYSELQVEYVIARINHIGTVNASSYNKINAAQIAYNKLPASRQSEVTNYSLLVAAWNTYSRFAAQNVINRILDLPDLAQAKVKSRETLNKLNDWFGAVSSAFDGLATNEDGTGQQGQVKAHNGGATYKKLTDGLAELIQIEKFFDFKDALGAADVATAQQDGARLKSLYESLTPAQQQSISLEDKTKYDEIINAYTDFAKQAVKAIYNSSTQKLENTNGGQTFNLSGGNPKTYKPTDTGKIITVNGETYLQAFEFNSGSTITFYLAKGEKKTLKIYTSTATAGKEVIYNGKKYSGKIVETPDNKYGLIEIEITGTGEDIVLTRSSTPVIFMIGMN